MRCALRSGVIALPLLSLSGLELNRRAARPTTPVPLAPGVRGLVTLSPAKVIMDGRLREWSNAFCTPVQYNHRDLENRAAQFFYMWDDEALYIGLRCLDLKQANHAALASTYDGDAVEFYLDTRPGAELRDKDWTTGAIHLFFSAVRGRRRQAAVGDAAGDRDEQDRARRGGDRGDPRRSEL